jgi:glycosyltransferase involved in cell wall biosynthesis
MLSGFRPAVLSVWGSDVYDFPERSWWRRKLIQRNLRSATRVASTSHTMAAQTRRLVPALDDIAVTPFGVDCERFQPRSGRDSSLITIGTVKTLAPKYGIDILIRAFAALAKDEQLRAVGVASRLRLLIVGSGPERRSLEMRADTSCPAGSVHFAGAVEHAAVPDWLNRLDVYVAARRDDSESFGVAVIEASACGLPVVVSDAGGLPEVVVDGATGFVVPRGDHLALAHGLRTLIADPSLRTSLGAAGRSRVLAHYDWPRCVDTMLALYRDAVAR